MSEILPPLDWMTAFRISDTAAESLARKRPHASDSNINSELRAYIRQSCVATLRWIWVHGTPSMRKTLVFRVHIWLNRDPLSAESTARIQARVAAVCARLGLN